MPLAESVRAWMLTGGGLGSQHRADKNLDASKKHTQHLTLRTKHDRAWGAKLASEGITKDIPI